MSKKSAELRLEGVAASPGITIGPIKVIGDDSFTVERVKLRKNQINKELLKFDMACSRSKEDLEKLYRITKERFDENTAQIFKVHAAMLDDPMVSGETQKTISNEAVNADYAFEQVMSRYIDILDNMKDEIFRARRADILDLKNRVIRYIQGDVASNQVTFEQPSIVFARELTPSATIRLDREHLLGFAMDFGGRTSHATILARSIKVPAVVGLKEASEHVSDGCMAILDGEQGVLIVHPTSRTISRYKKRYEEYLSFEQKLESIKTLPARTKDGKDIELASNIEFPNEIANIEDLQGDGIGLYRTEYLFLAVAEPPSEEQQFKEYTSIVEKLDGKPVIIRTFDLGGDKPPRFLSLKKEDNPFLGVRGIRLYRNSGHDLFRTQLRAILRASAFGDVRIMFPMIACVSEMAYCHQILNQVKHELKKDGHAINDNIPVGAMIEVPSAAATADLIAEQADFLSIGTNDLIQYTTAVDRGNKDLTYLYQPYNPAVLRLIQDTIHKGHQKGVWVGLCGEMASDPLMTMVLIGMGLDEFSISPVSHLMIKEIIRHVDVSECENLAHKSLQFRTSDEVSTYLRDIFQKKFKNLLFAAR